MGRYRERLRELILLESCSTPLDFADKINVNRFNHLSSNIFGQCENISFVNITIVLRTWKGYE